MFWSWNTRTAYRSIPASIAATSTRESGRVRSTPATSPAKQGPIWRMLMLMTCLRVDAMISPARPSVMLEVAQEGGSARRRRQHEREVGAGEDEAHAAVDVARHQLLVVDAAHARPLAVRAAGRDRAVVGVDHALVAEVARDAHLGA